MLPEIVNILTCPHCGGALRENNAALVCSNGHSNNIARQGYVSLLGRDAGTHTADSVEMVAARQRFLGAGHFRLVEAGLVDSLAGLEVEGPAVDLGAGPGHYLAGLLDALPGRYGLALDNSKFAARRAARCHPRAGAVVADIWDGLPIATESAAAAINVFSPRNGEEIHRILKPGGRLVVVTPRSGHLGELIERFGMISVDPDKEERLERSLESLPEPAQTDPRDLDWTMKLDRQAVADLVAMGPSADRLAADEMEAALAQLEDVTPVSASVRVRVRTK